MTSTPLLSPRPGPPNEQSSARVLRPIYQALDTRNYGKALKLTSAAPQNEWDIVRALRVHALERSGKKREALVLLWEVIVHNVVLSSSEGDHRVTKKPEEVWPELYDRIASLSDASDLVNDSSNNIELKIQLLDAVQILDKYAYEPIVISSSSNVEVASKATAALSGKDPSAKLKVKICTSKGSTASKSISFPPVTDETVLNTLVLTLRNEGMYDTMSELFFQAMESGRDEHVLEDAVYVHFQAACDCTELNMTGDQFDLTSEDIIWQLQSHLPKLRTLLNLTKYYERMQSSSLQLAKLSTESLHFQWAAVSSLWYSESLKQLMTVLEMFRSAFVTMVESNDEMTHIREHVIQMVGIQGMDELSVKCQKMNQKLALLPRLAESLSTRIVSKPDGIVSENDWDIYLETLLVQGKKDEALKVFEAIECTPMLLNGTDKSLTGVLPLIDDENTIESHVGSILPYTQRKKLERIARLSLELSRYEQAEECYRELLACFPDQWTYWLGLVDACIAAGENSEKGWNRCRSFAEEVIANDTQKHSLRGPHLFLVEIASLEVKNSCASSEEIEQKLASLREEICKYGKKFGPVASCCFADLRPYLRILSEASSSVVGAADSISNDMKLLLGWAKVVWTENSQSVDDDNCQSDVRLSYDEALERRAKLRSYIFAVQIVYYLAAKCEHVTLQLVDEFAPLNKQIILEWRSSLTYLPGVAPKDGGQKEVLPGDELVLLLSQNLQRKESEKPSDGPKHLLEAAAVLEEAMDLSPYNPHLKIASIGVYLQLGAPYRAFSIYQEIGIKQIQMDSCSYLILPSLIKGGLYTSAVRLSSSILRLHSSTSKDIKDFASKSLQNGYLFKAREMSIFQRAKMRPSSQLLYSKGVVMACASVINASDFEDISSGKQISTVKLGSVKGLCGGDEDVERSEQIASDSSIYFNAPYVIHEAANTVLSDDIRVYSDNRDMGINYFEILHRTEHLTRNEMITDSLHEGNMHGLLVRAVMAVAVAKAPKKGKVAKSTEEMTYRCKSLTRALTRAKRFVPKTSDVDSIEDFLWTVFCSLCDVIGVVIVGKCPENDALADRENASVQLLEAAVICVNRAQTSFNSGRDTGALVCRLLPAWIVPIYTMMETTARLFALFGWGKRKRLTKAASGALARLALSFRSLLSDLLQVMMKHRCFEFDIVYESLLVGPDATKRVINKVIESRNMTKDRVDPFLDEMIIHLASYEDGE